MFRLLPRSSSFNIWAWGKTSKDLTPVPRIIASVPVTSLANGMDHSGYVSEGKVWIYGPSSPVLIDSLSDCTSITCGPWHSVCQYMDGTVRSFGWGGSWMSGAGGLGLGSKAPALVPTLVPGLPSVVQVACGNQHTLFLTDTGAVWATGHGAYGILGTGDSGDELVPVELSAISQSIHPEETVVKIACGGTFSAILTDKGNLYVWGRNDSGQLGLGEESQGDMHSAERYPRLIPFFEKSGILIKDITCGETHMVALTENGALYYWGDRQWLEPHLVSLPEANGGIAGIKEISGGSKFSLALTDDGLLFGWGAKKSDCLIVESPSAISPILIPPSVFGNQKVLSVNANRNRCSVATDPKQLVATTDEEAQNLSDILL